MTRLAFYSQWFLLALILAAALMPMRSLGESPMLLCDDPPTLMQRGLGCP